MRFPEIQIGLLALTLSASAPSQCSYPAMPRGGFALTEILDTELTYRDGARTKVDVCYPSTPASCGWPVVFWMHGMTAERTHILSAVRTMARRGFAVVSFDVRGHGDAARMNGARFGFELVGRDERLDIVEIVEHLRARHGGKVDVSRLGMYGYSQGAMYAWAAAAWSGRPLPTNPRGLTTFPTFKAICPLWWAPLTGDVMVPRGKGFTGRLFSAHYEFVQDKKITPGSSWYSKIDGMIRSQDFAGVKALFDNDPFRQELNLLRTCTVPVFTQVSWNDDWVPLSATLDAFAALPASTPRRGFLTFPGHDGPRSVKPMQGEMTKLMAARWLNRFLKEIRNDVENESLYITGAVNQTSKEFLNLEPVWNRYRPAWPPAHQQTQTWYLRSRGVLSTSPPTIPASLCGDG